MRNFTLPRSAREMLRQLADDQRFNGLLITSQIRRCELMLSHEFTAKGFPKEYTWSNLTEQKHYMPAHDGVAAHMRSLISSDFGSSCST